MGYIPEWVFGIALFALLITSLTGALVAWEKLRPGWRDWGSDRPNGMTFRRWNGASWDYRHATDEEEDAADFNREW